jgi:hypothetical protein
VVTEQEEHAGASCGDQRRQRRECHFRFRFGPYVETLAQAAAHGATLIVYGLLDMRPTPFPFCSVPEELVDARVCAVRVHNQSGNSGAR